MSKFTIHYGNGTTEEEVFDGSMSAFANQKFGSAINAFLNGGGRIVADDDAGASAGEGVGHASSGTPAADETPVEGAGEALVEDADETGTSLE